MEKKNIKSLFSKRLSWNFEESLSRLDELGHHFIFSSEKARVSGRYSGAGRCEVLITEDLLLWLDNKKSVYRALKKMSKILIPHFQHPKISGC